MEKMISFIKEHYVACASVFGIALISAIAISSGYGKGTFSIEPEEDTQGITVVCDEVVSAGSEVECKIIGNFVNNTILSINANFGFDEGISYISFSDNDCNSGEDCFTNYYDDENGFAVLNLNGLGGNDLSVGSFKIKLPAEAEPNSSYNINLTNVELVDTNEEVISFEDEVFDSVRVFNNDTSLSKITYAVTENGTPIEVADFTKKLVIDSDVSNIWIDVIPTDSNATVSGDGSKVISYGTNNVTVTVLAEDGVSKENHTIVIYRPYKLKSDIYSSTETYLYTKNDVATEDILSNLITNNEDGVTIDITDNKLKAVYVNETLLEVDIINFESKWIISDKNINIDAGVTYEAFIDELTFNGVTAKVVNTVGEEILSGAISEGAKLIIYKDQVEIDSYVLVQSSYEFDEELMKYVDDDMIKRLPDGITFGKLKDMITTTGSISLISNDGASLTDDSVIKTGDSIQIKILDTVYTYALSVLGDINGDGYIDAIDVSKLYTEINLPEEKKTLDGIYLEAANIVPDGYYDAIDVSKLYSFIVNRGDDNDVLENFS